MKKVTSICRVAELNTLAGRIIDVYTATDLPEDTNLASIINELKHRHDMFTIAIKKVKSESDLEHFDEDVNNSTRSLFSLVEGYTHHPDTSISGAAESLNKLLANYGRDMIYESYAIQTTLVDSLLNDLEQSDCVPQLQLLPGCDTLVQQLHAAQKNFKEQFIAFEQLKVTEKSEKTATDIKRHVLKAINHKLIPYVSAMAQLQARQYNVFAETLEAMINEINQAVAQRRKTVAEV